MGRMTAVDQAIRDEVTRATDASIALSAGAGSGKTSVLTERLVNVLAAGVDPSRIAAITFTEKAAGELQRRVRDALEGRLVETGDPSIAAQLDRYHELTLSTIHSFCRGLLALEPLAARWAPGTEIIELESAGVARGLRRWRMETARTHPLLLGLIDLTGSDASLRRAAQQLVEYRDLAPRVGAEELDFEVSHAELTAARDAIEAAASACTAPDGDKLLANNADLRERLASWIELGAPEGTLAALVSDVKGGKAGGRKGDWPGESKEAFKQAVDAIQAWRERCFARAHRTLVGSLREHVVEAVREARAERAQASFSDLLFRAAALLKDDPAARARLANRFDAVLIDEVQDTDPIQAEIAALLAREPSMEGDWLEAAPRPGRLFAVGDPKQSVYRFRRADVAVWRDLEGLIAKGGAEPKALSQNFRSVPGVVAWTSHVFADMPDFAPQVAAREPAELDPVVVVETTAAEEFDHAIRHLSGLVESGARVVDRASGEARPMRWGDVMILLPRWSNVSALVSALERARIEAVVEGGGTFFEGEEVRLAVSALRAMSEPADSEATVHALRGLFGFTWEDLAAHVAAGGSFRMTVPDQPPGPVRDALETLRDLRMSRVDSWVPPLDRLLEHTRAPAVWALRPDGRARLANLDKLRAMLRRLELESRSATQVITLLEEMQQREDEDDLSRADPSSDAVLITTVYKAKGLEAPVVALLDMNRRVRVGDAIPHRAAGEVSVKVGSFQPEGWKEAKQGEEVALTEEQRRLLYVACTRARDQLVILRHDDAKLLSHLIGGWDAEAMEHEARQTLADGVEVRLRRGAELPPVTYTDETFPERDRAVDALLEAPARRGDAAMESRASRLRDAARAAARKCQRTRSVGEIVSRRRAPTVGSGVGSDGGLVVHRALEQLDWTRDVEAEIDPLVDALALELGVDEETTVRCAQVVRAILGHPVMTRARRAPELWKETPFSFHDRGRAVTGVIDLCFPEDEARTRWVVVDYKSDLPAQGSPLRARYEAQLRIYAEALLSTVAACEHVEAVLVGPHEALPARSSRELVSEEVDPALRAGVSRLLAAGATLPRVGADVGEPVIASLELAWIDEKVGLGLDLLETERAALAVAGWTMTEADTAEVGWARKAEAALREALGLAAVPDDQADDGPDVGGHDEEE